MLGREDDSFEDKIYFWKGYRCIVRKAFTSYRSTNIYHFKENFIKGMNVS